MKQKTKKYTSEEATAKIKILLSDFYENVGRDEVEDLNDEQDALIMAIDIILSQTKISSKQLIVERLKMDEGNDE